jgi:hypothetical protein
MTSFLGRLAANIHDLSLSAWCRDFLWLGGPSGLPLARGWWGWRGLADPNGLDDLLVGTVLPYWCRMLRHAGKCADGS